MSHISPSPTRTPRRDDNPAPFSSIATSPTGTSLGHARTLKASKSNGSLARQFVDRHSTIYAHLYEHDDEVVKREKLEREQEELEADRRLAKERRERITRSRFIERDKENESGALMDHSTGSAEGKGVNGRSSTWRPLSLLAKRQPNAPGSSGHTRSASHQIPSTIARSALGSVSHTPGSFAMDSTSWTYQRERSASDRPRRPTPEVDRLDSLYEDVQTGLGGRMVEDPEPDEALSAETTLISEPRSTYSWATSFSGESAELRATATYLRRSLEEKRTSSLGHVGQEEEEVLDTPQKTQRRRKRIVAIAHTVRQLEGVGSREAEDPEFYGQLVKAWNERPGFGPSAPAPVMQYYGYGGASTSNALTDAPPALLPPPNLPSTSGSTSKPYQYNYSSGDRDGYSYGRYSDLAPPPNMSPAFERHFGSPPEQQLITPAMGYDGSTMPHPSVPGGSRLVYTNIDDAASDTSTSSDLRARSFRYSYASALHDLALEDDGGSGVRDGEDHQPVEGGKNWARTKGPMRWSGAWEGWNGQRPEAKPSAQNQGLGIGIGTVVPSPVAEEEITIDWSQAKTPDRPIRKVERQPITHSPARVSVPPNFSKPLAPLVIPTRVDGEEDGETGAVSGGGTTPKDAGWGLGFMGAWWSDRPGSSRQETPERGYVGRDGDHDGQDFHLGEGETCSDRNQTQNQTMAISQRSMQVSSTPYNGTNSGDNSGFTSPNAGQPLAQEQDSPSFIHSNECSPSCGQSISISGVSTPSFGVRIHASAERRWVEAARPSYLALNANPESNARSMPMIKPMSMPILYGRFSDESVETAITGASVGGSANGNGQMHGQLSRPQSDIYIGFSPSPSPLPRQSWLQGRYPPMDTGLSGTQPCSTMMLEQLNMSSSGSGSDEGAMMSTSISRMTDEREFPFSSHCRPPSFSTPSISISRRQHQRQDRVDQGAEAEAMAHELLGQAGLGETKKADQGLGLGHPSSDGSENGSHHSEVSPSPPTQARLLPPNPNPNHTNTERERGSMEILQQEYQSGMWGMGGKMGLLERRQIRPLKLGDMLNPLPLQMEMMLPPRQGSGIQTELPSSISRPTLDSLSVQMGQSSSLSLIPTPTSIQTHFLPPLPTPVGSLTPTSPYNPSVISPVIRMNAEKGESAGDLGNHGDVMQSDKIRREIQFSRSLPLLSTPAGTQSLDLDRDQTLQPLHPNQSLKHSFSHYDWSRNNASRSVSGGIRPIRQDQAGVGTLGQLSVPCPPIDHESTALEDETAPEVEVMEGYRDPTPSLCIAPAEIRPNARERTRTTPKLLFWLGWIMPWCWVFGGWPVAPPSSDLQKVTTAGDVEKGLVGSSSTNDTTWLARWLSHPDPWARRCRIATVTVLPAVAIAGVVGVIVLAVTRGG